CFGAAGSVLPITMRTLQRTSPAPDDHHLRPLMTKSSPSRAIRVSMFVASDEATAGSVMQNAERISPFSSGARKRALISSLAKRSRISMLPVSGAEQLNTSDDQLTRPLTSQ